MNRDSIEMKESRIEALWERAYQLSEELWKKQEIKRGLAQYFFDMAPWDVPKFEGAEIWKNSLLDAIENRVFHCDSSAWTTKDLDWLIQSLAYCGILEENRFSQYEKARDLLTPYHWDVLISLLWEKFQYVFDEKGTLLESYLYAWIRDHVGDLATAVFAGNDMESLLRTLLEDDETLAHRIIDLGLSGILADTPVEHVVFWNDGMVYFHESIIAMQPHRDLFYNSFYHICQLQYVLPSTFYWIKEHDTIPMVEMDPSQIVGPIGSLLTFVDKANPKRAVTLQILDCEMCESMDGLMEPLEAEGMTRRMFFDIIGVDNEHVDYLYLAQVRQLEKPVLLPQDYVSRSFDGI